jgi:pyruvate/2-oxoglutarate/acetoin dehydrogenase E1 component
VQDLRVSRGVHAGGDVQECHAALVVEDRETFRALKAPVRRVCAMPVPVPYSPPLEQAALPSRDDIKTAVYDVLKPA